MSEDLYVVTKFIFAKSAKEAMIKEKKYEPNEIWMDKEWKENKSENFNPMGFEKNGKQTIQKDSRHIKLSKAEEN